MTSLISFIIVPAHQRIVFLAGVDLVFTAFFGLFIRAFLPWVESTEFVQMMVANMTSEAAKAAAKEETPTRLTLEL